MAEERKRKVRRRKGVTAKAKKKEARARASIRKGTGRVRINHRLLECLEPVTVRRLIREPLDLAGERAGTVDVDVNVSGGGFMGQAVSSRAAIAKALYEFSGDEKLRQTFLAYDRMLLVDDPRRVEPKKPLGTKARKKKQRSKR